MSRYAILAEGNFDYLVAKTGNAMIRYRPENVACVIDSITAGKTVQEVIGYGGDVPVLASLDEALRLSPDTLLVAIAPAGGQLPDSWRRIIRNAIENKLDVVSGLHTFLSQDREFSALSEEYGVSIRDLRRPPDSLPFSKGSWRWRKTPVLLTVGTDCDSGKMTAAWEIKKSLEARGQRVAFVGTGQTGILLGGFGVAVDAVVSDFVAGTVEAEIDKAAGRQDLVIVEGQGSITHMAYSGVTLGLLHGTMPDMMVMCHEPGRAADTFGYPMQPFDEIVDLHLRLLKPFKAGEFVGISLLTQWMSEEEALRAVRDFEMRYDIPATDPIRFGTDKIAESIVVWLSKFNS